MCELNDEESIVFDRKQKYIVLLPLVNKTNLLPEQNVFGRDDFDACLAFAMEQEMAMIEVGELGN